MIPASKLERTYQRFARSCQRLASAAARVIPRRSVGEVEAPATLPASVVTLLGWTSDPRLDTLAVIITIDGAPVAVTRPGVFRADVHVERPRIGRRSPGFEVRIDLAEYEDRQVRIGGLAVRQHGIVDELGSRLVTVEPRLVVTLANGREALVVRGTLRGPSPASSVTVLVDGTPIVSARPWRESPSQRLEPHAIVEGFDAICPIDTSNTTPATTVTVDVHAHRLDGSSERLGPVAVSTALDDLPVPQDALEIRRQTDALREAATVADERRLLVVTHSLELGGAQLYVEELLSGLLPSPDVACLVVAPADGPLRQPLEQRGITVEVLGDYPGDIVDYEARVAALATLARAHGVHRALINTMSAALGADTCRRLGIPYVWAIHESVDPLLFWIEAYGGAGFHPEVRTLGLDALNHAEQLVFEADATLELYRSTAPAGRCVKIPYGIDFSPIDDHRARVDRAGLRASLGYSDKEIVFVCVGTMEPRKLQTGLVLAFHAVVRRFPNARLVLVGDLPERPYSQAVHELIDRLGVAATVAVVPVTPDVYDWYHAADVVVSASDLESMPRSLMEAMAFERVILSTAVFGVTELIADGRTGFLMAPRQLDAMIEGFERVLALSTDERAAIGRAASDFVRASHDASAYVSEFRTLLLG